MKRSSFRMVIVSTIIISILNSCAKVEPFPGNTDEVASHLPITVELTADHWVPEGSSVFACTFANVIPAERFNHLLTVYMVINGNGMVIDHPIPFEGGALWTTHSATDLKIHYRPNPGSPHSVSKLSMKFEMVIN